MAELEQLIRNLPELAQEIIRSLLKKKAKEVSYEKKLSRSGIITMIVIAGLGLYGYLKIRLAGGIGSSPLGFLLGDPIILLFFAVLFYLFVLINHYKYKFEKAEKDVDKIREDIIDRSSDIWNTPELLTKRYRLYKLLKDEKDIDLFHK